MKKIIKHIFYRLPASYTLMFHHIDDGNIAPKRSGCTLDFDKFIEILDSGLQFIDADTFCTFSRKSINKALITFDDGLADVYNVAYPQLKKRNIPFTIFIVTDFLDTNGYLTTAQLKELAGDPLVTVGSHGLSHGVLKDMPVQRQLNEILKSKELLESLLNRPVKYFAYSHGQYDNITLNILRKKRCYSFAFGVAGYPTNIYTRRWKYHLPRLNCENGSIHFRIEDSKKFNKTIKFN